MLINCFDSFCIIEQMDDKSFIIKSYLNGLSTVKISKIINMSPSSIRNILIKNGVTLRSNKINSKKYDIDENYFENINSPQKAYWLGFIYADGYVTKNKVGITLNKDDIDHLYKFKESLNSSYPVHVYKSNSNWSKGEYCRILITNDKIVNDLIRLGVLRNKSNVLEPPKYVPDKLINDFIRGYFDGDGCLSKNGNSFYFSLIGTPNFINWIIDYFKNILKIECKNISKRHDNDIVVSCKYFGESCFLIINLLYKNADIYLKRKYERYVKAVKYFSQIYQK